jgi:hypothetical protein
VGRSHLLSTAAQAALGVESAGSKAWLDTWVPKLKREDPEVVMAALRALPAPIPEAVKARRTAFTYRGQRREQIRYAHFQEQGYPIGSGSVESAGTVVVEARLKGSGRHWERENVNPLLALRGVLCSGRWDETWPSIWQAWRLQVVRRREDGGARPRAQREAQEAARLSPAAPPSPKRERAKTIIDGRPTETNP